MIRSFSLEGNVMASSEFVRLILVNFTTVVSSEVLHFRAVNREKCGGLAEKWTKVDRSIGITGYFPTLDCYR